MTDGNYIRGLLVNDQKIIDKFYGESYNPFVSYFATHYKKSEEEAQDLFHDSLVALWDNVRDGKITEQNLTCSLYYYLRVIGLHKMMAADRKTNELMRLSLEGHAGEDGETILPASVVKAIVGAAEDEEAERGMKDLKNFVERAVVDMNPPCDKLLRCFYWDRMSYAQIITLMDFANTDSAKTQKNKCMKKLKPVVEKFRKLG